MTMRRTGCSSAQCARRGVSDKPFCRGMGVLQGHPFDFAQDRLWPCKLAFFHGQDARATSHTSFVIPGCGAGYMPPDSAWMGAAVSKVMPSMSWTNWKSDFNT